MTKKCSPRRKQNQFAPPPLEALPIEIVLSRLKNVSGGPTTFSASCPSHLDCTPSLSVTETAERVVLAHCHRGCDINDVLTELGLQLRDMYPSAYALEFGQRRNAYIDAEPAVDRDINTVWLPSMPDLAALRRMHRQSRVRCQSSLRQLAGDLGVSIDVLNALEVGYDNRQYLFPERDGRRRIIGLMRRDASGAKHCVFGSMRGLTIAKDFHPRRGPIFLTEGASDTAALISSRLNAVGRPAARASHSVRMFLKDVLIDYPEHELIVVGDNDRADGGHRAGAEGARRLARYLDQHLQNRVSWALPRKPYKDAREQILANDWKSGLRLKELKDE